MRHLISDQLQPKPYLAPLSHNTSVTNENDDNNKDGRTNLPWIYGYPWIIGIYPWIYPWIYPCVDIRL